MASSKDLILENARILFAANGFKGTTIAQIAKTSNVTDAAIYRHYRSKQEVFDVIVETYLEEYRKLMAAIKERQKSGYCLLETLILDHCGFIDKRLTDTRVLLNTYTTIPSARAVMDALSTSLFQTVEACLIRGIRDGTVRDDIDVPETARIIGILLLGLNRRRIFWPETPDLAREVVAFCQRSIKS